MKNNDTNDFVYGARFIPAKVIRGTHCNESQSCKAFCHVAWCPKDNFYKEWVENYNKAPWFMKIFMNPDPRSAWF